MSETREDDQAEAPTEPSAALTKAAENAIMQESESATGAKKKERNIDALMNVKLNVRVVLGHNRMPVSELLQLTRGSVIELDRKVGDPVDIMVNDRLIARGDLVKIEGNLVGVALRELIKDFVPGD